MRRRALVLAAAGFVWVAAAPAQAQVAGGAPSPTNAGPPAPPAPRWEIEGYGGFSLGRISSGGSAVLPDAGPPITTSSPIFPSRRVSSWFFGDGAMLLNDVSEQFGLTSRITPLDSALASLGLNDAGTAHVGVRIRRQVAPRYGVEVGLDVMADAIGVPDTLRAATESSRATFETTFSALLTTGPFAGPVVRATSAAIGGSSREIAITGAVVGDCHKVAGFVPYVTLGGGVIVETGDLPSATIEGSYRFAIGGTVPVSETDRVTLHYEQTPALAAVFGGGIRRDLSGRWGLRIDARVLLGGNTTRLLLDATPAATTGAPAGFIESFTYPNLQFSNNASTGRESTLSGSKLQDFEAFAGGLQTRVWLTIGVFVKF